MGSLIENSQPVSEILIKRSIGGIPYTAFGAQITPLPHIFVFLLILGKVKARFAPQGWEIGIVNAPQG